MVARFAMTVAALLAAGQVLVDQASAESMNADTARRFVAGKLFAFNCFDGSRGAGRIYADGSVIGTVQFSGSGPVRSLWLPAGTLRVKGETYCAALKGMPFEPCFNLNRTDDRSFRGSISGMSFAYCDFTKRAGFAATAPREHASPSPEHEAMAVTARRPD
jgi:hypothetical protein